MSEMTPDDYREAFTSLGGGVAPVREQAFDTFAAAGFPTRRLEEWRYTNPAPITKRAWSPASDSNNALPESFASALPALGGSRLVFVDGRFAGRLRGQSHL